MIVLPAIDILGGKVVRLKQGRLEDSTIYNESPADQARTWAEQGAEWIHVVDLDGAVSGEPHNIEYVETVVRATSVPVQVGGGVRNMLTLRRLMDSGVKRVVLGTTVITEPEFVAEACAEYADGIVAGIDARDGMVAVEGWRQGTTYSALDVIRELEVLGVHRFVYTDIELDGMQTGVNYGAYRALAEHVDIPIIASGGISTLQDLSDLAGVRGVEGAIIGRALYEELFTLPEAIEAARGD